MSDNLLDRVDAVFEQTRDLARRLHRSGGDPTQPNSDRQSVGATTAQDMGRRAQVLYGHVVDAIAYCHWYKVQPEGGKSPIPCRMMSGTSLTPFGVRDHNPLHPNAGVYFVLHPTGRYGSIIGVEPTHQFDGTKSLSDYVSMSSNNSVKTETVHRFPFTLPKNGTVVDWSAGRPVDATSAGERGLFAETGVGWFVDPAMAFVRADENCGAWFFYRDQLARLAGHNLQIRSGGWEVEALDDQGEFNHYEGFTPYPWEQLGGFDPAMPVHRELTAEQNQTRDTHYARYEPKYDDQQPFHRTRVYHGYAGQGGKRTVVAPPADASDVARYSDGKRHPAVYDETVALTGRKVERSAKGFTWVKQPLIPSPRLRRRPEDVGGDSPANYSAAGAQGNGPPHAVVGGLPASTPMGRAMGGADARAYAANWEGYSGFAHHALDYDLPDEADLQADVGVPNAAPIPFSLLAVRHSLPAAVPGSLLIDHRYGRVDYYPSVSYLDLADDGGVSVGDGWGCEDRSFGGNRYIDTPGDLYIRAGRRIVLMAGTDVVVKGRNSVDVSATLKDVRVHSGLNTEIGANGGVLIESKSQGSDYAGWEGNVGEDVRSAGVMIKAAASGVAVWSDFLYARTGVDGRAGSGIHLDSGKGEGDVVVNARSMTRWLQTSAADYFGGSQVQNAVVWGTTGNAIGGGVSVDGNVVLTGGLTAGKSIASASGHVSSALSASYDGKVGELKDESLEQSRQAVDDVTRFQTESRTDGGARYTSTWDDGDYGEGGAGADGTVAAVGFSFRTEAQYGTADFQMPEARWQQLARLAGSSGTVWSEFPVVKGAEETYPFPGREKTAVEDSFYTLDPKLVDPLTQAAKPRTDPGYSAPAENVPTARRLNASYTVIG